jgi:hypothetical protein
MIGRLPESWIPPDHLLDLGLSDEVCVVVVTRSRCRDAAPA